MILLGELREVATARVELTKAIGTALAENHFQIINAEQVAAFKRKAARHAWRAGISEKGREFWESLALYTAASMIGLGIGAVVLGVVGALWAKLILVILAGTSAELPWLVAATAGASTAPIIASGIALWWVLHSLTGIVTPEKFAWHEVDIPEYLPPLISAQRLEMRKRVNPAEDNLLRRRN